MTTKLIAFNREINPDVHFENPTLWTELLGTDWSVFANSEKGARKTAGGAATLISVSELVKPLTSYKYVMSVTSVVAGTLDLTIGNTTTSIPLTASPVIYTGTITTSTGSGLVLLNASAANVSTINYLSIIESPESYELDLTNDISIPLSFAIADIKDLSKRDTAKSLTVTLPGTKNNNKYFKALFEIERDSDFKPGKKRRAIVEDEGETVFNGVIQLKKINRINNGLNNYDLVSYEVVLLGQLAGFYTNLGDTLISELDYSEYDHVYGKANQADSWYTQIQKNGVNYTNWTNGSNKTITAAEYTATGVKFTFSAAHGFAAGDNIFISAIGNNNTFYLGDHKVRSVPSSTTVILYYPFIQFSSTATSYSITGTAYKHEPTGEGYYYPMINYGQNNGYTWQVNQMYPSIYLYTYLQKIAEKAGYILDSDFIETPDFKRIVLGYGGEGRLTDAEILARTFRAEYVGSDTAVVAPADNALYEVSFDDDSTSPNFDGGSTFNLVTNKWTVPATGLYNLNVNLNLNKSGSGLDLGAFYYELYNFTTSTVLANTTIVRSLIPTSFSTTALFSLNTTGATLTSGDIIGVRVINYSIGNYSVTIDVGTNFYNECTNTFYQEGSTISMNQTIPKRIKCADLFRDVCKAFRLVIQPDLTNDKKLVLEPEPDFFGTGTERGWTSKLDTAQKLEVIPMGELNNKVYNYNYKPDNDYLNEDHIKRYGKVYGNKREVIDNDFIRAEYNTDLIFSPTVLQEYPVQTGRVISTISDNTIDANKKIFQGNPRLLYTKVCSTQYNYQWYHKANADAQGTAYNIYPYAGHLDKALGGADWAYIAGPCPTKDLNFDYPVATYYKYAAWTDANLFNLYHKKELDSISDPNSNVVMGYLYLKPSDIRKLDFRDVFVIDGHALRLNSIIEWTNGNTPTLCEFVLFKSKPAFVPTYTAGGGGGASETSSTINESSLPFLATESNSSNQVGIGTVNGQGNIVSGLNTTNVNILGNNNVVNQDSSNITITGDNNLINGGMDNVNLIGSSNNIIGATNFTGINIQGLTIGSEYDNKILVGDLVEDQPTYYKQFLLGGM
jgi:hypothetical protein